MSDVVNNVREIVMKNDKDNLYKNHIRLVVDYALELCELEKVDKEEIKIAALLHDIGRLKFGGKKHNETGADEARKILIELNYDDKKTDKIWQMIFNHNIEDIEFSLADEILRCADALSHLDVVPFLLNSYVSKKRDLKLGIEKMIKKLDDEWDYKLTLESARKIGVEKYLAAKLLLETNLEVLCK